MDDFTMSVQCEEMVEDYQPSDLDIAMMYELDAHETLDNANRALPVIVMTDARGYVRCQCPGQCLDNVSAPSLNPALPAKFCGQCGTRLDWSNVDAQMKAEKDRVRRAYFARKGR
jgi:hypothetical protein